MRLIHISGSRRRDGNSGGVEKFAWYLEQAVGCELLTDSEYDGSYDGNTTFIIDGDHGKNIPAEAPVVSVAHGTWAGLHRRWLKRDIGDGTEQSQIHRWRQPNVKVVSVSPGVTRELREYCAVEPSREIWHGVSTFDYKPPFYKAPNKKPVVLHAAQGEGKGLDKMEKIQELLPQFELRYLDAKIGEEPIRFAGGDMYLHASLSDGNSYAVLEAMSTDLPCVVTNVGLFEGDFDEDDVGRILPYTATAEDYADAIIDLWENREDIHPRKWVMKNARYRHFATQWREFLK